METRSDLATGHARTANARTRMRNGWSEIAGVLNSDGNGCVKDWKQWAKYWKDKKAAVKRKASLAEAARQRTGGGIDAEVVELSDLEQRILMIAGGLSFATGDRHLSINPFQEHENLIPLPESSEPISNQSESLLQEIPGPSGHLNHIMLVVQDEPPEKNDTAVAVVGEGSVPQTLATPGDGVMEVRCPIENEDETISIGEGGRVCQEEREIPPASTVGPRERGARRQILLSTPSPRRRLSQPLLRPSVGSPRVAAASARRGGSAARRRLLRRSPPAQRRSEMASLTERFIAIEERRVDAELAIARSQEIYAEGHRMMAEALRKFTETFGIMSQKLIEALHERSPSN